jgi:tetratricopeptide (TPR) repeat protein
MMSTAQPRSALALFSMMLFATPAVAQTLAIDSVKVLAGADRESALTYAEAAVAASPDDADAQCALSLAYGVVADDPDGWELAVDAAERCVELGPNSAEHQFILGVSSVELAGAKGGMGALGPAKRGKAALERAIELDPNHVPARLQLFYYLWQAPGIAGGSKRKAKRQAEEIEQLDPVAGVHARWLLAAEKAKDEDRVEFFDTALPLAGTPADSQGYAMSVATATAASVDSDALAERLVGRLYQARPDDPRAGYYRARLWTLQGRNLEEAQTIFEAYIAQPELLPRAPSFAGAHWRLGLVYEKQGRKNDALEQYRAAAELFPNWEAPREDVERLEKEIGRS